MIGTVLNDRYRLDAELGRGGMGVVYRARDVLLDRDVAIKVVSRAFLGTEGRARLLREARSAAQLNHRNVVSIYDAGEAPLPDIDEPVPFIVMELVAGPTLHDRPPDNLQDVLRLAAQVCAALEHAHRHGIVHRDLKPENVLLALSDASEKATAKLNDFGLARSMASRLSTDGTIVGTVFYLAPELALGQEFDGRADLYALGVMLYELATGELPFTAADPVAVISQHLHAPPVPPRARNAAVPAALDAIILRLLAKRPEDRPSSAGEVGDLLERLAAGEAAPALAPAKAQELSMLDRITRGRLVAREGELAQMRTAWHRAAGGDPVDPGGTKGAQVLLVSGEPGVGKSRLVRELVTQVQVQGDRALIGECYAEGGAPYAPFGQMVRQAVESGSEHISALPDFVLADLVALAPALRLQFPDVPPNPTLDPQSEQQRLFESVVALCAALAARRPLLLVLEDGHWADSGSLALLRYLARRTRRQPVLIVVTYREVEMDETHPFRDVVADLNRERLATPLKLSPLDRDGTRELLAALFAEEITPEFLDGIYRETEGNPFFVEEVCKALVEDGAVTFASRKWNRPSMDRLAVPQSVRLAIQSRLGRLPGGVRHILEMAALLGREFSADVLVEAVGKTSTSEEAVIEALEIATRAQLVEEVGGGREPAFSFVHALIAATLVDEVPTLRRRRLHCHAGEAVERLDPENDEALAHHYAAAGDEERALTYSLRAGDRAAALYANAEAERHYRAALELVGAAPGRAGLLEKLGGVLAAQGRYEEAFARWQAAVQLFTETGNRDGIASLYTQMSFASWERNDSQGGLLLCREGMAAVARMGTDPAPTVVVARLLNATAGMCRSNGLFEEAEPLVRQSLALAEQLGAVDLQADCLCTLALLPISSPQEAVALLSRAAELAQAAGLLPQAARAEHNLAVTYAGRLGDLRSAHPHSLRAVELRHRTGAVVMELKARAQVVWESLMRGMLATAEGEIGEMRQLQAAVPGTGPAQTDLTSLEAQLLWYRGRPIDAARLFNRVCAESAASGDIEQMAGDALRLADLLFEIGEYQEAEAAAREAIRGSEQIFGQSIMEAALLSSQCAERRELELARSLLPRAREQAADRGSVWDVACLLRAEAHLAAAEERWPEALAAFESMVGRFRGFGARWYTARFTCEWAEALLARGESGDREQACSLLSQAAAEFEAIGSPYYAEKARRRMNELGPA